MNIRCVYYFSVCLVIVEYFLPLSIISFAYARISYTLWGNKAPGEAQDQRDQQILGNKKKVIILVTLVGTSKKNSKDKYTYII